MKEKNYSSVFSIALLSIIFLVTLFISTNASYAQGVTTDEVQKNLQEAARLKNDLKDVAGATKIINDILGKDPKNVAALAMLGQIQMEKRNFDEALKTLDSALSIQPTNTFALRTKGEVLMQQNKFKEAEEAFNKAVQASQPKSLEQAWSYFGLVKLYVSQGIPTLQDKAKAALDKALAIDPNNVYFKQFIKLVEQMHPAEK